MFSQKALFVEWAFLRRSSSTAHGSPVLLYRTESLIGRRMYNNVKIENSKKLRVHSACVLGSS